MSIKKGSILIVDDNEELLIAFSLFLGPHFKNIKTIKNPGQLINLIRKESFDIILLDMNFEAGVNTGNEGIFWMNKILEEDPLATIILITAFGDVELAVRAMKKGAVDFIHKSWDEDKILSTLLSAYKLRQSKIEIKRLKQKQKHLNDNIKSNNTVLIASSEPMQKICKTITKVATTDANILIIGENGTGKEVVAREIHRQSDRSDQIFVNVDLGALTETLFESELFGYKKGAFTDAKEDRAGRFEIASGGTLFLDEISNTSMAQQSKILSAIQNKEIIPVGSQKAIQVDIRLIFASNKNLVSMVSSGTFREDLLYRINTILIEIPPLRKRKEDIFHLSNHFLTYYSEKYNKQGLIINQAAFEKLISHDWKGNVRELQHVIEKAVILSNNSVIKSEDIFFTTRSASLPDLPDSFNISDNEKLLINKALIHYNFNMSLTAKQLGINRSTLYDKIKKYGL